MTRLRGTFQNEVMGVEFEEINVEFIKKIDLGWVHPWFKLSN